MPEMATDTLITIVGLVVAGLAAVIGIWVERDATKPPRYAYALSMLILLATVVGMFQTYMDAKAGEKLEADMARMLQMMDKIANNSDVEIPELDAFVNSEIAAQSRANPAVVQKLAQRVSDEGGDPNEMLAQRLPPSEVESMTRKGTMKVKPAVVAPTIGGMGPVGSAGPARRPRIRFGQRGADAAPTAVVAAAAPPVAASADAPAADATASAAVPVIAAPRLRGLGLGGAAKGTDAAAGAKAAAPAAKPAAGAPKPALGGLGAKKP